jgi:hypothetical protein
LHRHDIPPAGVMRSASVVKFHHLKVSHKAGGKRISTGCDA